MMIIAFIAHCHSNFAKKNSFFRLIMLITHQQCKMNERNWINGKISIKWRVGEDKSFVYYYYPLGSHNKQNYPLGNHNKQNYPVGEVSGSLLFLSNQESKLILLLLFKILNYNITQSNKTKESINNYWIVWKSQLSNFFALLF